MFVCTGLVVKYLGSDGDPGYNQYHRTFFAEWCRIYREEGLPVTLEYVSNQTKRSVGHSLHILNRFCPRVPNHTATLPLTTGLNVCMQSNLMSSCTFCPGPQGGSSESKSFPRAKTRKSDSGLSALDSLFRCVSVTPCIRSGEAVVSRKRPVIATRVRHRLASLCKLGSGFD
jgi:hypothetical protein